MASPGTIHNYTARLVAFEHASSNANNNSGATNNSPTNLILWIGGLSDGLSTVKYPKKIAQALPPSWTLAEVLLSSAYNGWGTSGLAEDARELGLCVQYFRNTRKDSKIVLLGHSTGCQDIMEYLVGSDASSRPRIDGAILQGGVSDREGWVDILKSTESIDKVIALADKMISEGKQNEIVPRENNLIVEEFGSPVTAYRLRSLLVKGGDDDYFSSDLEDEVLRGSFGKIGKEVKVAFLLGSRDPYVPGWVDKEGLIERWSRFAREGGAEVDGVNGGVLEGGTHNMNDDEENIVKNFVGRVIRFVKSI